MQYILAAQRLRFAEIFRVRFTPVVSDLFARFFERDGFGADKFVQMILESVFQVRIPRLRDVTFRPEIARIIRAAKFAGNQMIDFKIGMPRRVDLVFFEHLQLHRFGHVPFIEAPLGFTNLCGA